MTKTATKPANTTLEQLGGSRRLVAMIGAKDFMSSEEGRALSFKFKGSKKANYVKITLNDLDTYDIEFGKIWNLTYKVKMEIANIYGDQLRGVIEDFTGLYLSMGTMGA